ncbi:MAG: 50S ribosomal protein L30 [Thermoleophilaceae bacterium]|jgi:large subunit ribosomal protein L30|nr:50S ribosomal protein L30 [Thermoleophilaceae bacterium]
MADKLTITQVRSPNGANPAQRGAMQSLGLGRIGRRTERPDDATVRGQIQTIAHLVEVRGAH